MASAIISNVVSTQIIDGLEVTKTANKSYWVDGSLMYNVVITNQSGGLLKNAVLTDNIDTNLVDFDYNYGVKNKEIYNLEYTLDSGELKVDLPELSNNDTINISFQVTKRNN